MSTNTLGSRTPMSPLELSAFSPLSNEFARTGYQSVEVVGFVSVFEKDFFAQKLFEVTELQDCELKIALGMRRNK